MRNLKLLTKSISEYNQGIREYEKLKLLTKSQSITFRSCFYFFPKIMQMNPSINLFELPIPQLQAVRQQIDEEVQVLTQSFAKLKQAQSKFKDVLDTIQKLEKGQVLLPLTNSLYVSGDVTDIDKVIVDVGTGYFVEKDLKEAQDYYNRKADYLVGNLQKLEEGVVQRQNQLKMVTQVLIEKSNSQHQPAAAQVV